MILYHGSNVAVEYLKLIKQKRYLEQDPIIIRRRQEEMSREAGFLIYCMERYFHFKGLSGSEVADLLESCKVDEYIMKYFEPLHTMGEQYIVKDIDDYIAEMKN